MKKNNLTESILSTLKLNEASKYGSVIPSFTEEDGFYSATNTEAFEAGRSVAQYFADYANFLTTNEEGSRYIDREMAPEFAELAKNLNASLDKIEAEWDKLG